MQTQIRLNDLDGAKEFVRAASKCDFDIDVYFNKIALDAKSILGMMSLDPRNTITVDFVGDNANFSSVLAKYAVQ
ncbi:MAG TPA: HPr family phosphocarrier protein [Candidatus Onthocola gallistercoris]|uniref:HPr family phosphocarrier protein n=1 Tax=Candidatus Onthocola gallistercoris TaxID=2840876 RepID=A0A9D1KVR7_9FIRM|nr:HPr family phosphocarrier protein [Candidatus Onthocola gallistercoris]